MGTFCINREDLVALESRLEQSRFEQSRFEQSRLEQSRFEQSIGKMSESEAQDAFIIFDEAYEGKDVDAFYLADILRAVGCNVTNASATSHGKTEALGEKLDADECDRLMAILGVTEDEDGFVMYEEFIANLLSKCP